MSLVTFIIPCMRKDSIPKTIQSLLNQTNPNWKCIIVYDGIEGPKFDDERISHVFLEQKQPHAAAVRNYGLESCSSEWIAFLDDDDTLDKQYVDFLLSKYSTFDFVIFRMKYPNGHNLPLNSEIRQGNVGISFAYKNVYNHIRFDYIHQCEDLYFLKKLESETKNWTVSEEIMYYIRH